MLDVPEGSQQGWGLAVSGLLCPCQTCISSLGLNSPLCTGEGWLGGSRAPFLLCPIKTLEWPCKYLGGAGGQRSWGVGPGRVTRQVPPVWGQLWALLFSPLGPDCCGGGPD